MKVTDVARVLNLSSTDVEDLVSLSTDDQSVLCAYLRHLAETINSYRSYERHQLRLIAAYMIRLAKSRV